MEIKKDMGRISVQYFSQEHGRLVRESKGTFYGIPTSKHNVFELNNKKVENLMQKLVSLIINLDLTRGWQRHVTPEQLVNIDKIIKDKCMSELIEAGIITKRTKDIVIQNMYYGNFSSQNVYKITLYSVSGRKLLDAELVTFFKY